MLNKAEVYVVSIFDGLRNDVWNQAVFYDKKEAEKYLDLIGYVRGSTEDNGARFVKPVYDDDFGLDSELYAEIERWEVR